MNKNYWLNGARKIKGVSKEQLNDYIFSNALDSAIGYAVGEWESSRFRLKDIEPKELIVRYNRRTDTIHIRHYKNPFIRMKEIDFKGWIELTENDLELFGEFA